MKVFFAFTVLVFICVPLFFREPNTLGSICSDVELSHIRALGCGGWPKDSWFSCYAENSSPALFCDSYQIPLNGTACSGSEMCPSAYCYGAKNQYCGGWTHSGKECTTQTVIPCCTIKKMCETRYDNSTIWPGFVCDCSNNGSWAMGSRTVATLGAACSGSGQPNPTQATP